MGTSDRGFERVSRGSVTSTVVRKAPDEPEPPQLEDTRQHLSPLQISLRYLWHDRRALICGGILLFLVALALIGPPIYQHIGGIYPSDLSGAIGPGLYHQYYHEELSRQDELPSAQYWLGTDSVGRDILARLMQGLLISLTVAVVTKPFSFEGRKRSSLYRSYVRVPVVALRNAAGGRLWLFGCHDFQ